MTPALNTAQLRDAYRALLDASITVLGPDDVSPVPPAGEWNAIQILAHIASVDAGILAAAYTVASGASPIYDNRPSLEIPILDRIIALARDSAGLRDRIRLQGDALCALGGEVLTDAELDTPVPSVFASAGVVLMDQPVPLRGLIIGLAEDHLPRHTAQLLALLPQSAVAAAAT